MSKIAHSFEEMARYLDLSQLPSGPAEGITEPAAYQAEAEPAGPLAELLTQLQTASAMLASAASRDDDSKALALTDLDRYDNLLAQAAQAEAAAANARQLANEAEVKAANAFAEEAREAELQAAAMAAEVERQALELMEASRDEADRLAERLDLDRLRAERRRQNERAAEAERSRRLSEALQRARAALHAGQLEEAKAVLGRVCSDNPDNAEIASLLDSIAQRELTVRAEQADETLHTALFEFRKDAATALTRLEALDVEGLPEPLSKQVFGGWARVCSWRCKELGLEPRRYAPKAGRGAVIVRHTPDEPYTVFSAIGMGRRWAVGSLVSDTVVEHSRPLP